jgi:hypothetical protein
MKRSSITAKLAAALERAERAEAFKRFVHQYLDQNGVPDNPGGIHGVNGCRIGDRLDWILFRLDQALDTAMPAKT